MKLRPIIVAATLAVSATATAQDTADLQEAIQRISQEPAKDKVLYELQAGTLALDMGERDAAAQLFDRALTGITAVYAQTDQAANARSAWENEGSKVYKGEPYERAMAFYYRGLLDMFAGDYENARASFRSGILQDAFAEEAQHQADFAMLMFLDGWCSHLLGADALAEESFEELKKFRPDFVRPPADHNTLIIAESGKAPRKLQDGIGGNILVYRQGKRFKEVGARAVVGDQTVRLTPMESVYWQASTRGGRAIDGILEGQVKFKQNTQKAAAVVSGVASEAALYAPLFGESSGTAAAVAGVAGVASLLTSGVKARADDRFWNNLPDMVHVYTMALPEGVETVDIEFLNARDEVLPEFTETHKINVDAKGRGLVWARSRSATDVDTK